MDKKKVLRIAENPSLLEELSPREFEELVAELLSFFKWDLKLTSATRDGGYDILGLTRDISDLEASWVVECKKYHEANKVGVDVVRNLYGAKHYLGISNAVIVTTSSFTKDAQHFSELKDDIKLVDREWLVKWLRKYIAPSIYGQYFKQADFYSCFISHSSDDIEFSSYLTGRLRQEGVKTWFSHDDLLPG